MYHKQKEYRKRTFPTPLSDQLFAYKQHFILPNSETENKYNEDFNNLFKNKYSTVNMSCVLFSHKENNKK